MRVRSVVLGVVASWMVAGCKPAAPPVPGPEPVAQKPAAPATDACQVLTAAEISNALGVPIDAGTGAKVICFWRQTGQTGDNAVKVVLNFSQVDVFEREKAAKGNVKVTAVPGIGDEAISVRSALGTSLLVRKGNTSIGLAVRNMRMGQGDLEAKERVLGASAASRI